LKPIWIWNSWSYPTWGWIIITEWL